MGDMTRTEELKNILEKKDKKMLILLEPYIKDVILLEKRLAELREMPFMKVHPEDNQKQRMLPAFKMYKETMNLYMGTMKIFLSAITDVVEVKGSEILEEFKRKAEEMMADGYSQKK